MFSRRDFLKISGMTAAAALTRWECPALAGNIAELRDGEYHAVIIGSGLGGLTCAAFLAVNGFKPLVIEKHNIPGGYATSFTRTGDGQTFPCEVSLHGTSASSPDTKPVLEQLEVWEKVEFVDHKHVWTSIFPDFTLDMEDCSLDCFEKILIEQFPEEQAGISEYMGYWKKLISEYEIFAEGIPRWKYLAFPRFFPTMWDVRDKTLADIQDRYISNDRIKAILSQHWNYYGLPPSKMSAFYYLEPTGFYHSYKSSYIVGTSQSLSNAMVEVIESRGGNVLLSTKATEIILKKRRAVGVKTENGDVYYGKAVVSNASVPQTFGELIPEADVPADYMDKISAYEPAISFFNIWLGLNQDISSIIPQESLCYYPNYDLEEQYQAALDADPEKATIGMMIYSNLDKGNYPAGYSTVSLLFCNGYDHWKSFEADYFAGNKEAYYEEKNRITEALIRVAEEHMLPGLSEMIVMKEASTPLTNKRYTLNTGGSVYGYEQIVGNSFMTRLDNRADIKRLYLASAWSDPGGGYTGVILSGKNAFKNMIEDRFWLF